MRRRRVRRDLLAWSTDVLAERGYKPAAHHKVIVSHIERLLNKEYDRLMIFAPPGSAKSTFISQLLPTHLFARFPGCQIIGASHTSDLAEDFSGKIHSIIRDHERLLGYGLKSESRGRWYTTNGGSYLAAGVGGAIPGFRADFGIIDDPIKGRQAADSEADRKRVWDWYLGDFERRLTPGAPVILMHTRWMEDDLAGRLLSSEPDRWKVLSLPAEAEDNDPLGRAPGEFLWNDDAYGYGASLADIKKSLEAAGASREWYSQYQQRPRPYEGALFKVGLIGVLPAPLAGGMMVRAWDLASTEAKQSRRDPDWTRGVKLQRAPDGRYVVLDVTGIRGGPDEVKRLVMSTAQQDGHACRIGLWQDPGQAGKAQVLDYTRALAGYTIEAIPATGDKETYARPVASQCNVGNLYMVAGPWNRPFIEELGGFPFATHDDQIDALSRAFMIVGLAPPPMRISSMARRG